MHPYTGSKHPAPLHWCHDMRPCSGTILYMEGPVLIPPYSRHHSNKLEHCQDATPDHLSHLCTVRDCFLILLNVSLPKITDPFPIKKLFHKLENSNQTYINYHKTHAMATHYGGIGDTSMENPESQDIDSDSQENYQMSTLSHFNT